MRAPVVQAGTVEAFTRFGIPFTGFEVEDVAGWFFGTLKPVADDEFPVRIEAAERGRRRGTPTILPARFADSERYSPASYIAGSVPSLLLIQGTADPIVRVETVDDYVQKLQAAAAPDVTYVRIEGGDHSTAYDMFMVRSTQAISEFFARTLRHAE